MLLEKFFDFSRLQGARFFLEHMGDDALKEACLRDMRDQKKSFGEVIRIVNENRKELKAYLRALDRMHHLRQLHRIWSKSSRQVGDYFDMNDHHAVFPLDDIPNDELRVAWTEYLEFGFALQTKLLSRVY